MVCPGFLPVRFLVSGFLPVTVFCHIGLGHGGQRGGGATGSLGTAQNEARQNSRLLPQLQALPVRGLNLMALHWELDPSALRQQHDLPTGNPRDRNHVGRPDRGDHGLRQVCPRANDPPKPDMGVEDNQRSASQSSGSLAGEMMSPRIRPLPAMSGGGWRFGEAGGSSRTKKMASIRTLGESGGRLTICPCSFVSTISRVARMLDDPDGNRKKSLKDLNRVQSEMRNFHGVFGLGDFTNLGGHAV